MEKTLLHCHCWDSRYDSPLRPKDLVERAKELGYSAVTLTDHGTLTGIDDFVAVAKEAGIKPIPGVEAYVHEDDAMTKNYHLILLAKDDLGFQGISKAVTDSNRRINTDGKPCMNKAILQNYFSEGKPYHDHVIATSACIGGVLGGFLKEPLNYQKEIKKLEKKIEEALSPLTETFEKNKMLLKQHEETLETLTKEKDEVSVIAKQPFKKKENQVAKLIGTDEYTEALNALNKEKAASEKAKEDLEQIRLQIRLYKKYITETKAQIKEDEKKQEKINALEEKKKKYEDLIISPEDLEKALIDEMHFYENLFGKGNFFVELQYHGFMDNDVPIEAIIMRTLANTAKKEGIPVCAANDVHIKDNSKESIRARQILCAIKFAKKDDNPYPVSPGDDQLYIKTEEELREALSYVADPDTVDEAIQNTYKIGNSCNCAFEKGTHYPKFPVTTGETADEMLKRLAYEGIETKFPERNGWDETYQKRLDYELSVISSMGYSDYFLIVLDFLTFGRKLGKLSDENIDYLNQHVKKMSLDELTSFVDNAEKLPGFGIGAGRGSAAGSLVAYLVGITDIVDPLKYDLLFERFLNKDRVSMPDVDSDLSPDIRDLVVEYCKKLYGTDSVANIVTKGFMAPKGAIRNAARILRAEKGPEYRDYYLKLADEVAKKIPSKPGTSFADCEEALRADYKITGKENEKELMKKKDANELIDQAKLVEGVFLNYGMHAAGVIIADGHPLSDYVPLMKDDKSGDMKVQCNMVQAEEVHGLLKFDFLGLKNLKIVTQTIRSVYKRTGRSIDVTKLPFEDCVFENIFAKGLTGSVFQFESSGMKDLLRKFKPTCFEDLIALVSLYRPGPMDFIPQYINAKYHPESINYLTPELEPILGKTYGCIVYQEQVMEIFQKLAGYSLSQADNVRRFMSKKKHDKLAHEKEAFVHGDAERGIDGCLKRGISEDAALKLFDQMFAFASYAFNKSHAAAYAMLSYITAWLKYYYPSDYMCAILNCNEQIVKVPGLINDCKEFGIKILPPNINRSEIGFSAEEGIILFGLNSIKGTKTGSIESILKERTSGEFTSFKDFIERVTIDKTSMENLIKAGAMDEFSTNRTAMLIAYSAMADPIGKIREKKELLSSLTDLSKEEESTKLDRRIKNAKVALETAKMSFDAIEINDACPEDFQVRIKNEKNYLGFYITAHPLDTYRSPEDLGCQTISSITPEMKTVKLLGVIENFEVKSRKSDGKKMAFFDLEDKTGIIHICCFTKAFDNFQLLLEEDAVLKISGNVNIEENEEDGSQSFEIYMEKAEEVIADGPRITIFIDNIFKWNEVINNLKNKKYFSSNHPLVIYDRNEGIFHNTTFYVKDDVLEDPMFDAEIA